MTDPAVTWDIPGVDRKLPDGDTCPDGAIYAGGWTATYEKDGQSAYAYGSIGFPEPDPENFTPYSQLTKEQVMEWTLAILGEEQVKSIENSLKAQVEEKLNPTHANGRPWN
jgi:hypothetical protein